MNAILVAALAGLSITLFFWGLARLLSNRAEVIESRLEEYAALTRPRNGFPLEAGFDFGRVAWTRHREGRPGKVEKRWKKGPSRLVARLNRAIAKRSSGSNIATELARADLKLTSSEYVLMNVASILICFLIGALIFRHIVFALGMGLLGLYLPRWYVTWRQRKRLHAFNDQLSDAITLIANSLRAGYSLMQSLETVSKELPPPIAIEFARVVREIGLGLSTEEALNNLLRRIASDDLDLMVTAIKVNHEVGGNLAEILDTIGHTIRERVRIKGEIRVLTATQRYSAYILIFLPVALGLILYLINPQYMSPLLADSCGWTMIIMATISTFVGYLIMRKIVSIEV